MPIDNCRILVTNDDGINASGLQVLERVARSISKDVWVAAPETEQSGAGHSLTLHVPLRVRNITPRRFAVSGTPTDCVLLAVQALIPKKQKKIALVLSGVNRGSNVADDVTYSGTIAAAMEGTLLGIPSIALSQSVARDETVPWATAEKYAAAIVRLLLDEGWPPGTLMNVNFPGCRPSQVKGVRCAPQGKRKIGVALDARFDPKGRPYYWMGGEREDVPEVAGVDLSCLLERYITITPLCLNLTDFPVMERMMKRLDGQF